jgi:hypothetical protein
MLLTCLGVGVFDANTLLWEPIRENGEKIAGLIPHLINALYILAFGWVLAFVVQFIFRKLLVFISFDKIADKTGVAGALKESGIETNPTEWFSLLSFWIVMIGVVVKILFEMGLFGAAGGVDLFSGFVFQSLGLLAIFLLGIFLSVVLGKIVYATSVTLKIKSPQAYSRVMQAAVLVFTLLLVLRQIAVPMNLVILIAGAVFVSLCIAFIIAFGVGGRNWAAKMLDKMSR